MDANKFLTDAILPAIGELGGIPAIVSGRIRPDQINNAGRVLTQALIPQVEFRTAFTKPVNMSGSDLYTFITEEKRAAPSPALQLLQPTLVLHTSFAGDRVIAPGGRAKSADIDRNIRSAKIYAAAAILGIALVGGLLGLAAGYRMGRKAAR
jgi:hypothetical protein